MGDGTKQSEITVVPKALSEAEEFLAEQNDSATATRVERIATLISGFETPYGMELLATVHWAATQSDVPASYEEVVERVRGWNERKRALMSPIHIRSALDRLAAQGWLVD